MIARNRKSAMLQELKSKQKKAVDALLDDVKPKSKRRKSK